MTRHYTPRLEGAEREAHAAALRKKYDAGASIRDLVEEDGRAYGTVHQLLAEAGTVFRSKTSWHEGRS
ncbi:helix-turn-helix domain-containing protein [Actinacidiphila sp. DG2A-62]|uniref:helix-turn-helix domain-containing protein n=1 Tax=Actinacidiphila sp. DG2A-62 TaxID=3108821 RepID=UPI002DB67A60|nr:helix-turn-helix domain-containing protein [Actinacidiphila sp. DG2A-62]MEC3995062.1 helix-turn-helix domain-containing protein [Actinacidiphila sp. DG2A-62]